MYLTPKLRSLISLAFFFFLCNQKTQKWKTPKEETMRRYNQTTREVQINHNPYLNLIEAKKK